MYQVNNGYTYKDSKGKVRDCKLTFGEAVINDGIFLQYMMKHGMKVKQGSSQDFIVLKFKYNVPADDDHEDKISAAELRKMCYENGCEITYHTYDKKTGEVISSKTIKYRMLYRTPGKAKEGSCVFINEKLLKIARKYLTMNLYKKMPEEGAKIVEMSAYSTLITASAVDYIHIPLDNILIVEDKKVATELPALAVKVDDGKHCFVQEFDKYPIENVLWDGMGLIDDSIFPEDMEGFIYCRTLVQRYNAALAKSYASNRNVTRAQNNTKKAASKVTSARKTVSTARATYNTANGLYQSYAKQYSTASKYLNSGNTLGYQNYLTDMEFNNTKQQNKTNQDAYAQAKKNTQNMEKQKASAKNAVNRIVNRNKATGTRIANKYSRKLSQSQINALKAGKTVSTRGTSGTLKRQLEAYNKALSNSASALRQARDKYYDISTKVDIARKAEEEAAATAAESQAETAQAAIEAEKTKFENVSNYYDKRMDYEKALAEKEEEARNFADAHGDYTKSSDYNAEISSQKKQRDLAQQKVDALKKQLASALSSGKIKKDSEEWLEMSTTITEAESAVKDLDTTIENTKQKQLTTKYEEMFDRAIAKAEQLISKIDTINDLLTEEMMYDYDTGQLTDMGALSLTLNAQSMNDSLDTLQNYVKKRQQIIDDYNNKLFGEQKYDELMSENDSNIQNALKNANSYKQQILSIVKTQSQKEQDALFKVIDARKEALKKKKEYYDYDKQLKSKTKEINLLQQQIDALDGVTDAESRAQKARLEAQLKDAQDDLDDTVRDHVYDLQVDGLDDLEDQLKEDLEKWSNELSGNLDKMSKAINNAINNSGASAADAMNTLAEVLKQFNITPDQLGISASNLSAGNIKKYDKGTKHIGHNSVAMTNENGREIVVTNKGWLTKLGASDQIISTDNTEALIEMAEKYRNNDLISNIKIPEIKSDGDRNVVYNYTNNSPVTIQGDLVRDTLPDLQTILKESNKYTQNEMRKNLRRT